MKQQPWTHRHTSNTRKAAWLAGVLTSALPLAARAASVFTASATVKIRPADPPGQMTSVAISAARNEFEPFQVAIAGGASGATGVQASASALVGPDGATIPASQITLFREALYLATQASGPDGATGPWPDALVPDVDTFDHQKRNAFPFDVPAGQNRVIWAEVLVPVGATPGDYAGTLTVTGAGLPGGEVDVPVALTVHRFTLPSTPSLHTAFGMYWAGPCVGHFGSYAACGGDSGVEAIRNLYTRAALDHRISIEGAVYYGPSNGDWTHFDATYGPLLDGTAPTRLAGAKLTALRYQAQRTVPLATSWATHFRAKGWFGALFDYTCDEPPATCAWSDIPARAAIMKQADPQFRTLVTTTLEKASAHGVANAINLIVPLVNEIEPKGASSTQPDYASYTADGNELWWYQSCMSHGCGGASTDPAFQGWPTYAIDSSAIRNRAQEWLSFKNHISTELYYETTLNLGTAWTSSWDFGGNGDGTLFYPGRPDVIGGTTQIPVSSIRLDLIREGIEDYEYLKMLADAGEGDFALAQAQALFPLGRRGGERQSQALYQARALIAQHLDAHYPPPSTSTAGSTSGSSSSTGSGSSSGTTTGTSGTASGSATTGTSGAGSTGTSGFPRPPDRGTYPPVVRTPIERDPAKACLEPGCGPKLGGGCGAAGADLALPGLLAGLLLLGRRRWVCAAARPPRRW